MGFIGDFIGDIFGGGDEPAEAGLQAAGIEAQAQREALGYLKEREEIPRQFSEAALKGLGGLYGMPGGTGSQQELIQKSIDSPFYQEIMGGRKAGEEAILRSASATGGLRSGNVQEALYDYDTQLQNKALLTAYNQQLQGLQGLAGLPSRASEIAGGMAGIGETKAAGIIGSAQSAQESKQQGLGNLLGLGGLAATIFSDRRLKKNIKKIAEIDGFNWYEWDWNIVAQKMGLKGSCQGVMADEVINFFPDAVSLRNLFMIVDYSKLGLKEVVNG